MIKSLELTVNNDSVPAEDLSIVKMNVSKYFMNKEICDKKKEKITPALFLIK